MNIVLLIILLLAGILAIIIEFFVPAAGILGIFGFGLITASVVIAYTKFGILIGNIFLIISIISLPIIFYFAFKLFPKTFFGKKLILFNSFTKEQGYESHNENLFKELLGKEGKSLSILRPTGIAIIESKKYNVITGGEFIEKDQSIKVLKVEGNKIIVKKI